MATPAAGATFGQLRKLLESHHAGRLADDHLLERFSHEREEAAFTRRSCPGPRILRRLVPPVTSSRGMAPTKTQFQGKRDHS
jgi:hypothetical protein